ncbi:MAG: virulence RhuM family protein [Clostridiales bacterium]|jgi:hypothetical protein|nr:virulence RhuM family protein [Clostridiales bacterium]
MQNKFPANSGDILIYKTEDGKTKVEVVFDGETVWLTQAKLAELFQRDRSVITKHINEIFKDGEIDKKSNVQKMHIANSDKPVTFYNLDLIIAVGYRVKSHRGIQFRKWASEILKEYMKKGFAMNDDLLKQAGGGSYFRELLDRIRDIRSSEKVFYRQVLDLFATSVDYDAKSEIAAEFFKVMQNKLLFANTKSTAAELVASRANAELPFMGLQAFKGDRPQKNEVTIAKNYLTEDEIIDLNLMVSAYLDIAEAKARERIPMYMKDWVKELSDFIVYRKKPMLDGAGKISREDAIEIATTEYEKYREKTRDELTQAERDFLDTIRNTYELLEHKPVSEKKPKKD